MYQIACGHDVTEILALSFCDKKEGGLGYGKRKNLNRGKIEELLRVVYDYRLFADTNMYIKVTGWENDNKTSILDHTMYDNAM